MSAPHLTVAYMTNRLDPKIGWFFDSFHRETGGDYTNIKLIVVDFHADLDGRRDAFAKLAHCPLTHVTPKPNVWQGKHRITKRNYFAAANARNTAVCLAPDGWLAYVDDLSVLMPGWFSCVRDAMANDYIVCGAYKKVLDLKVEKGEVQSFTHHPPGVDSRWLSGSDTGPVVAAGSWLFGCSVAMPVNAILTINGWDEDCDSLGSEDYICGIMLSKRAFQFRYDRRMLTLESEELHHAGEIFKRYDKGLSPRDKSHAMLNMALNGRDYAPNYFGEGGIVALRQRILAGEPFPIQSIPQHDWFDGQPLCEL